MPLYSCLVDSCDKPGLRAPSGRCDACFGRFCANHAPPCMLHNCPTYESDEAAFDSAREHLSDLRFSTDLKALNTQALCKAASRLRNGIPCQALPVIPQDSNLRDIPHGGMNIHLTMLFEDGVEWICRLRLKSATSLPLFVNDSVVLSEAATLQYLSTKTSIPVPKVFGVVPPSDVPNGLGYIFMEKMNGTPLDWYSLDEPAKRKILNQLADIFISLHSCPVASIGCLRPSTVDSPVVGGLFSEDTLVASEDGVDSIGPFTSTSEYLSALIRTHIKNTVELESHADPLEPLLALKEIQSAIPLLTPRREKPQFYIKHMDDKGDHILIDEDFNITAIIDWEWAQTLPKEFAFASPLFLLDVGSYFSGEDSLSVDEAMFAEILEEKGEKEVASCVRNGRVTQRVLHAVDDGLILDDLKVHLTSFRRLVYGVDDPWSTWKDKMLKRLQTDDDLKHLRKKSKS